MKLGFGLTIVSLYLIGKVGDAIETLFNGKNKNEKSEKKN